MSEIQSLNAKLEEARKAYYAGIPELYDGQPRLLDSEYDRLERRLEELVKEHPEEAHEATVLATVGTDKPGRIPHRHPMKSIENKYSFEELVAWVNSVCTELGEPSWPLLTLESKWDGISASLAYENGRIVQALTRGDGDAGESILPQVLRCPLIPQKCPEGFNLEIRGELVIHRSTMDQLNADIIAQGGKPFISPRNLTAGTMKLGDLSEVERREVRFYPWEVRTTTGYLGKISASAQLSDLFEWGFPRPDSIQVTDEASLKAALDKTMPTLEVKDPEVGRDGLVLKVDHWQHRNKLGVGTKFARYQTCYKLSNQTVETTLIDVIWQVGRSGIISPVGILEPIVVDGAIIERVLLNNLTWLREKNVKIGSRIKLLRAGGVIPKLIEVINE
jgi:DNA ligase (NAD+)